MRLFLGPKKCPRSRYKVTRGRVVTPPLFEHGNAVRIFGPAGSGKTRALIELLREHIDAGDFRLPEGIIVSFTRAASYDIARRVNPDGEPSRYHTTLHALCKRYYGIEAGLADGRLKEFFAAERIPYVQQRSPDPEEWASSEAGEKSEGGLIYSFWSWCRNRLITFEEGKRLRRPEPEVWRWWTGDRLEQLWTRYVRWKRENGLVDFTEMLEIAVNTPPQGMQWAFFVLDEAQDSTPLQWAVANAFAACAEVAYIAGDDDQAIYAWAGATPEEFLRARVIGDDFLRTNHRSAGELVEASQSWIRKNQRRRDKNIRASRAGGCIESVSDVPGIARGESTFAMARAWYLLEPLLSAFEEAGVPFVDRRGKHGITGAGAVPYQRWIRLRQGHAITLDEWRLLAKAIPSNGPWLTRGTRTRLEELDKGLRAGTYVRLRNLLDYGATDELLTAISGGSTEPLQRLNRARLGYFDAVAERWGTEYLDEHKAAGVMQAGSIHAFKGLECDRAVIHTGMPRLATTEAAIDPEPERRVFYVAMTRAKERVTWFEAGMEPGFREVL